MRYRRFLFHRYEITLIANFTFKLPINRQTVSSNYKFSSMNPNITAEDFSAVHLAIIAEIFPENPAVIPLRISQEVLLGIFSVMPSGILPGISSRICVRNSSRDF